MRWLMVAILTAGCGGAAPTPAGRPTPPVAKRSPHRLAPGPAGTAQRNDPFYWLRDDERKDPDVLAYLRAENAYTQALLAPTEALQARLFEEIKGRIKKDDRSVPVRIRGYWYSTRYQAGKEYPIYCRRAVSPAGGAAGETQVMLDVNTLAEGKAYFHVRKVAVSESERRLAYGEDSLSRRLYTLRIKNLETGAMAPDAIPGTSGDLAWAADDRTIFYVEKDPKTLRPYRVRRHELGTPVGDDPIVYEERDETFWVSVRRSKSRAFVMIETESTLASETLVLDAQTPRGRFRSVLPREPRHLYWVVHHRDHFYVRTNWLALNFRLMAAPVATSADKRTWTEVVPHREDALLTEVAVFDDYLVVGERKDALRQLRIIRWADRSEHVVAFDQAVYVAQLDENPEQATQKLRYVYSSPITPSSVFEYDMATRARKLLKQDEVLGGFDPAHYRTERVWAKARDGARIPISLVYPKGFRPDPSGAGSPLYLYGYGAYGWTIEPRFSAARLSLLDRGFVIAIAHIRGGEALGRGWYEHGKLLEKKNTFTDFIDCSEHLIAQGYTSKRQLIAVGASAGGLLMGAVANMRPDLYRAIYAAVPFVDLMTTMLDESIPLTTSEYDEWGNPNEQPFYDYMLSYSPYDNIAPKAYPAMIVTTGLHDSQVQYWEPAKYVARLRQLKTDEHPLLLHTDMSTGHGGASGRFKKYKETAMVYAFLLHVLDPTPGRW